MVISWESAVSITGVVVELKFSELFLLTGSLSLSALLLTDWISSRGSGPDDMNIHTTKAVPPINKRRAKAKTPIKTAVLVKILCFDDRSI